MSDAQKLTMHGRDHRSGGHDPIPFPPGLLGGTGSVDLAVTQPGSLLLRYKLGEASGDAIDSAQYVIGVSNNLTYVENTGGHDANYGDPWVSGNAATRQVFDHTEFGSGDDGVVKFNYNQRSGLPGGYSGPNDNYPGARFQRSSFPAGYTTFAGSSGPSSSALLKSFSVFFKPTAGILVSNGILSADSFSTVYGVEGWQLYIDSGYLLHFEANDNSGGGSVVSFTSPGACIAGQWYQFAVTYDSSTHVWIYYMNGVALGTSTAVAALSVGGGLYVGGAVLSSTFGLAWARHYFYGEVDEIDFYGVTLTPSEVAAIYSASGVGSTTTVDTVTIGGGTSSDPFAVKSTGANQYDIMQSDGMGGSVFGRARIKTYHNGS